LGTKFSDLGLETSEYHGKTRNMYSKSCR
jgi:hypothetical protein